jgi:hypothetical protein
MSVSIRDLIAALALGTIVYRLRLETATRAVRMAIAMTCMSASWSGYIGLGS